MRETVVRARQAELANLSDVALLKRCAKAKVKPVICCALFAERGYNQLANTAPIALDGRTVVKGGPDGKLLASSLQLALAFPGM